ncbi:MULTISPECIES: NAD-dependent epimerase/dehydratase family protein [Catenuloplanes]|uniref:UDP-glucose 4-epimerase n=1 Tax=Catenuloplanes niger TaxID=587534 RepID=A0AAE4CTF4_9ACTN|nr:NAD-dependent epimerase/dehydratase family protein [Catenuloplanes niger]MDR7325241.1 UDP-glucose 4-epimerase [Catenuloplanes niger]
MTTVRVRQCAAAVIGATGFIGSRLVAELTSSGHPVARFNQAHPPVVGGRAAPGLCDAEIVLFLAARLSPALAERHPEQIAAERKLLIDVLEVLRRSGRSPVFVLASSGGTVYSPDVWPPYAESALTRPTSAYGRAKLRLERELLDHAAHVRPVILRLSNVYGPGQRPAHGYGVLSHWLDAAARRQPIRVFGDPDVVRDYVHVDDVAGILTTLHRRTADTGLDGIPAVLNVGSGAPTSLNDLLGIVSTVVDRRIEVVREGGRQFDRRGNWLDSSLAHATLGWKAQIGLTDGVRECWRHLLDERAGR